MKIINMQNKLYTTQFFSPPDNPFAAQKTVWTPSQDRDSNSQKQERKGSFLPLANPGL